MNNSLRKTIIIILLVKAFCFFISDLKSQTLVADPNPVCVNSTTDLTATVGANGGDNFHFYIDLDGSGGWSSGDTDISGANGSPLTNNSLPFAPSSATPSSLSIGVEIYIGCCNLVDTALVSLSILPSVPDSYEFEVCSVPGVPNEAIVDLSFLQQEIPAAPITSMWFTSNDCSGSAIPTTGLITIIHGSDLSYFGPGANGCDACNTVTPVIFETPSVDLPSVVDVCPDINESSATVDLTSYQDSSQPGGTWYALSACDDNSPQLISNVQNHVVSDGDLVGYVWPPGPYPPQVPSTPNCSDSDCMEFILLDAPEAVCASENESCRGAEDGVVSVMPSGSGFSYSWENTNMNLVGTTSSVSGLPPGTYMVTVTNNSTGCIDVCSSVIDIGPEPVTPIFNITDVYCVGDSPDPLPTSSDNGISGSWNTASIQTSVPTGGTPDIYTFSPTQGVCADSFLLSVTINPVPSITVTGVDPSTCFGTDGFITIAGLDNSQSYTLNYAGGAGSPASGTTQMPIGGSIIITGLSSGIYSNIFVSLTDCDSNMESVTLSDPIGPTMNDPSDISRCHQEMVPTINFGGGPPGTTYSWSTTNAAIGLPSMSGVGNINSFQAINNGTSTETAIITVTPTSANCAGSPESFTIIVHPVPVLDPIINQVQCADDIVALTVVESNIVGSSYSWTNSNPSIGLSMSSGNGNIPSFTAQNNTNAPISSIIQITPTGPNSLGSCTGLPISYTITINPLPTVSSVASQTKCAGELSNSINFSGTGANYTWTNSNPSIGLDPTGTGNISTFVLENTTSINQVATIVVTPTALNCEGTSETFTITVKPVPSVNNVQAQSVCAGEVVEINFSGNIPSGVTYSWTNNNTAIGLDSSDDGNISFTSTNNSNDPISGTITVVPTLNLCVGELIQFSITVNPIPTINNNMDQTHCNGDDTDAIVFISPVTGTNFSWTNSNSSIGLDSGGSGNIPAFQATNSGSVTISGTIVATPEANGCRGDQDIIKIDVFPTPRVFPIPDDLELCNDESQSEISLNGPVNGATYNWSLAGSSIGMPSNSGIDIIPSFAASNNGSSINTAIVTVFAEANICQGPSVDFSITVIPEPTINAINDIEVCEKDIIQATNFSGNVNNTTYSWNNSNTSIGLGSAGIGNISPSFPAENPGNNSISATISITPSFMGCDGDDDNFSITVRPEPSVFVPNDDSFCHEEFTGNIALDGPVANSIFYWDNDNSDIGLESNGSGDISFTAQNIINSPIIGEITITPEVEFNSGLVCNGDDGDFTITVRPEPIVNNIPDQFYCQGEQTTEIVFGGDVNGTNFSWVNDNTDINLTSNGSNRIVSFEARTAPISQPNPDSDNFAVVTVTPSAAGCEGDSRSFDITVWDNPNSELTLANQIGTTDLEVGSVIIAKEQATTGLAPYTYEWEFDQAPVFLSGFGTSGPETRFRYNIIGNYDITLVVTDFNGCTNSHEESIVLDPNSVCGAIFEPFPDLICLGEKLDIDIEIDSPNDGMGDDVQLSGTRWSLTNVTGSSCEDLASSCNWVENTSSSSSVLDFPNGQRLNVSSGNRLKFQNAEFTPTEAGLYELCIEFSNGSIPCADNVACETINVVPLPSISGWSLEGGSDFCEGDVLTVRPVGIPSGLNYIFNYSINGESLVTDDVSGSFTTPPVNPEQNEIRITGITDVNSGCFNNNITLPTLGFTVTPGLAFDVVNDVNIDFANCNEVGDSVKIEITLPVNYMPEDFLVPSDWNLKLNETRIFEVVRPINTTYSVVVESVNGNCDLEFVIQGNRFACDCNRIFPLLDSLGTPVFDMGSISSIDSSALESGQYLMCDSGTGNLLISNIFIRESQRFGQDASLSLQIFRDTIIEAEYINTNFMIANTQNGTATIDVELIKDFIGDDFGVPYKIQPVFRRPTTFCEEDLLKADNISEFILYPDPEPNLVLDPVFVNQDLCNNQLVPVVIELDAKPLAISPVPTASYEWQLEGNGVVTTVSDFEVFGEQSEDEFTQYLLFESLMGGQEELTVTQNLNYRNVLDCKASDSITLNSNQNATAPDINDFSIYLWPGNILVLDYEEGNLGGSAPNNCFRWGRINASDGTEDATFAAQTSQWFIMPDNELNNLLENNGAGNPFIYFVDISDCNTLDCSNRIYLNSNELIIFRESDVEQPNLEWQVFPNPTEGLLTFNCDSPLYGQFTIKLYNRLGQTIHSSSITKSDRTLTTKIDLSETSTAGLHYISITSEKGEQWTYPIIFN